MVSVTFDHMALTAICSGYKSLENIFNLRLEQTFFVIVVLLSLINIYHITEPLSINDR